MTTFFQDLRYGMRMLLRAPGFAAVAIATLALGIGANTAIFSVVNALLIRPLPYPHADRVVMVYQDLRARGGPAHEWATPGNVADWKQSRIFESVAAMQGWRPTLTGAGEPEPLVGEMVTRDYFDVLGVAPALGRAFNAEEDLPNAPRVVVLGHAFWQRRFGGDPGVIGKSLILGGEPHEVIGVMPAGFRPAILTSAEVWRPRRLNLANPSRGAVVLRVVARLTPDASLAQTSSAASVLAAQLAQAHPESNTNVGISVIPLQTDVVGDLETGLLVLLGAVAFVLLIACANIANLLLARASGRSREIAVRLALGAGRRRVVRQLLTESGLIAAAGGSLGVLVGVWAEAALAFIAPQGTPRAAEIGLDPTVLAFALAVTIVTGLVCGIVPAIQGSRADVAPALKDGTRGTSGRAAHRTRRTLIVAEVAVALVLLVGSGLLLRTLRELQSFDLGFRPDRVLVAAIFPPSAKYQNQDQQIAFNDRLFERVSALPGVEAAALSSVVPLGGDSDMDFLIEGRPAPTNDAESTTTWYRLITPTYFRVMGIPLKQGRSFAPRESAPAVIINETAARRYWNGENPIGRRVRFGRDQWFTIVGIVGDVQMRGARGEHRSEMYLPYWQFNELGTNVVLKTAGEPEAAIGALRQAVRDVDPDVPLANVSAMAAIVSDSIDQPRFFAILVGVFAALALALAVIGIYGMIAYAVSQRTAEIGVRMALGAERRDVFALVIGEGLMMTTAGVALGLLAAGAVSLSLQSLLFGVRPLDPLTFVAMTATLVGASVAACLLPARRAARVDPMVALRHE
jgi:putative ABC transport system permease protein